MVNTRHSTFVLTQRMDIRKEPQQQPEGLGEGSGLAESSVFANVPLWVGDVACRGGHARVSMGVCGNLCAFLSISLFA